MLSITRSPTVYSLAQLKEEEDTGLSSAEGGVDAIKDIVSSRVHLYKFARKRQIDTKLTRVRSFGSFDDVLTPEDHSDQATSLDTSSDNALGYGSGPQDDDTSSDSVNFFHQSLLDSLILAEWESKMEQGLFRYDVTSCPTHTMVGGMGLHRPAQRGSRGQEEAHRIPGGQGDPEL